MEDSELESIRLFADLTPAERARVASVARELHWGAGHVALREGEFAFDLYAIKQGAAEVQQRGERIASLGPGDLFGELGVSRPDSGQWSRRRTASVVVTAPTDVIAIDGGAVRALIDEVPSLRAALHSAAEAHGRGSSD
jgi:CRP/FNR family transcriptional regulator, cyclic AMP receptor protein